MNYSIAAVKKDATTTAFCLIDHSYFMNTPIPIIPVITPVISVDAAVLAFSGLVDFTVNDMYRCGSYIFFCGTINGTQAFYGYFNYLDFGMYGFGLGYVNVFIYCLLPIGPTTAPATLNKLVAYTYDDIYKIVAIGNEDLDPSVGTSKVVEIFDAIGNPSCKVADMPFFPVASVKKIVLDDIVLTPNYVVVLGHDAGAVATCDPSMPGKGYPWLSVGKRSDVIDEICDPVINPNYYIPKPDEAYSSVIGVALKNDSIAMLYINAVESVDVKSKFRVFDIQTMANTHSQQFVKDSKNPPIDMEFLSGIGKVEILQPMTHMSDYIQLTPYATTNYNTTMLNPNYNEFKSLCKIRFTSGCFISTRNAEIYIQDRTANLPHSTASCPTDYTLNVKTIDKIILKRAMCEIIQGENKLSDFPQFPMQSNILPTFHLNVQCFSYE